MAAIESFESFIAMLTPKEQESQEHRIKNQRADLLAARSEEARVRLVTDFIREVRESLPHQKK